MRWFNFERTRAAVALRVPGVILFSLTTFALLSVQTSMPDESQLGMTIRTATLIPAFSLVAYGWFALAHPSGAREFCLLTALMAAALLAELLEALVYNGVSRNDLAATVFTPIAIAFQKSQFSAQAIDVENSFTEKLRFEPHQMQVIAMYSGAGLSDTFILHSVALE